MLDSKTRRNFIKYFLALGFLGPLLVFLKRPFTFSSPTTRKGVAMILPKPTYDGKVSVEKAIKHRRTIRSYKPRALRLEDFAQILFAAQGITDNGGFKRAAPSGGALYPLDVYAVVGKNCVDSLDPGVYHYLPSGHRLETISNGDKRGLIAQAALEQMWMAHAPVNFVITAEYARICSKYGQRGVRYAITEAGHVGQNIFLQAEALGLAAGIVGAFNDREIIRVMEIPSDHEPLLIMPVGYQKEFLDK